MKEFKGTQFKTDGKGSVLDSDGDEICYVHLFEENGQLEIARLFSAAPLLLEALQEMCAIVEKHTYPCPDKPNSNWGKLEKAQAAINKALGDQ